MDFGASKRALLVAVAAMAVLALPSFVAARDTWTTKTLTVWDDTTGCSSSFTVGASWDKKGGQIDSAEFHLYSWDAANTRWNHVADASVPPTTRATASYTFTGLSTGTYAFTVFVWNKNGVTLGLYDGTASTTGVTC
jgi:uncharacterized protein (DUF2141 family)